MDALLLFGRKINLGLFGSLVQTVSLCQLQERSCDFQYDCFVSLLQQSATYGAIQLLVGMPIWDIELIFAAAESVCSFAHLKEVLNLCFLTYFFGLFEFIFCVLVLLLDDILDHFFLFHSSGS